MLRVVPRAFATLGQHCHQHTPTGPLQPLMPSSCLLSCYLQPESLFFVCLFVNALPIFPGFVWFLCPFLVIHSFSSSSHPQHRDRKVSKYLYHSQLHLPNGQPQSCMDQQFPALRGAPGPAAALQPQCPLLLCHCCCFWLASVLCGVEGLSVTEEQQGETLLPHERCWVST